MSISKQIHAKKGMFYKVSCLGIIDDIFKCKRKLSSVET